MFESTFPEKKVCFSVLDKPWMTPQLKTIQRQMQREFLKHRMSQRWKDLKKKFKKLKKSSIKYLHQDFIEDMKKTNPVQWYKTAKRLGGIDSQCNEDIEVEELSGKTNQECAEEIASHYSSISKEYSPINLEELPSFLPSLPPPQVSPFQVYQRLNRLKKTKATLPIDLHLRS